jgi:opacity protein-like surface antigen
MKKLSLVFVVLLCVFNANADEGSKIIIDTKSLYFGGGFSLNSLSGIEFGDGLGLQVFAGYELPMKMAEGTLSVEAGYMDSGNIDMRKAVPGLGSISSEAKVKGIWSTAVISFPLKDKLSILARAGLDFGDDDGFMFGAGMGYQANEKMEMRAEYVVRDNVDSLQFNVVLRM